MIRLKRVWHTALCIRFFKESISTRTRDIWYMYGAAHWGFACTREMWPARADIGEWQNPPEDWELCLPCTSHTMTWYTPTALKWQEQLSRGVSPAATEKGYGLSPLLWQPSSPVPSPHPPAIASTAGTVAQDEEPGATDPHEQSRACTVPAQSGSQGARKTGAVVIQILASQLQSWPVYSGSKPRARVACTAPTTLSVNT